jgi:uncharacterized membrane protein
MKKVIILTIIILISLAVGLSGCNEKKDDSNVPNQSSDVISETEVSIPLSDIGDIAKFYSYDADGIEVKYFAVKGSDGDVHAAFDACEPCYSRKETGYKQVGDVMLCNACPSEEFPINDIGTENTATGTCWPSYLPIKIDEGYVVIEKSDLEQNKWMFS